MQLRTLQKTAIAMAAPQLVLSWAYAQTSLSAKKDENVVMVGPT
jgi:hypothetical protein